MFATSDSQHHDREDLLLEKGAGVADDEDERLSDKILAHLLRSIVLSKIRQLDSPLDASPTRGDSDVDRKRGRSYIGRRGHSTEKRAADRERVYIGKRRTRWPSSSPAIN